MARRRSFVPESPISAALEGRVVLSSIGSWFDSEYKNIREDLGILKRPPKNAAAGIEQLWASSDTLSKPTHTAPRHHAPAAKVK